jgi:uncharacterized damage-inducible protein DinB
MEISAMFRYNWQVRDEWFQLCKQLPVEELTRPRVGGVGSILRTLYHIVDVEQSWMRGLQGKPEFHEDPEKYSSLEQIQRLSEQCRPDLESFLQEWTPGMENRIFAGTRPNGQTYRFTYGEVICHVIAHEIHHVGQLSVWARELGIQPPSANVIWRGLFADEARE